MSHTCCNRIFRGEAWACFFLRMWIGIRLTLAGVTKFIKPNDEGNWEFKNENASGVMEKISSTMKTHTPLQEWMLNQYSAVLPWALMIIGSWVIVGLFSRLSLIFSGLVVLSLSFGLLLMGEDVEGTFRALEIIVVALALITVKHNILAVDNLIDLAIGGDRDGDKDSDGEPERRKKD